MIHQDNYTHIRFGDASRRGRLPSNYGHKFQGLLAAIDDHRRRGDEILTVSHPGILGDTYGELVQSLSLIAEARLALVFRHSQWQALSLAEVAQREPGQVRRLLDRLENGYVWLEQTLTARRRKRFGTTNRDRNRP